MPNLPPWHVLLSVSLLKQVNVPSCKVWLWFIWSDPLTTMTPWPCLRKHFLLQWISMMLQKYQEDTREKKVSQWHFETLSEKMHISQAHLQWLQEEGKYTGFWFLLWLQVSTGWGIPRVGRSLCGLNIPPKEGESRLS